MDTSEMISMQVHWFPHSVKPVYEEGGDNRILTCTMLPDGVFNVCYLTVRPDGSVNGCSDCHHNEKWLKKHATKWDNLICTWWTYVKYLTPFALLKK